MMHPSKFISTGKMTDTLVHKSLWVDVGMKTKAFDVT